MYASAIGAGVSQLWDLLRSSQTQPSSSSGSPPDTTPSSGSGATTGTGSGNTLSSDLNTLLLDVQSGGTPSGAAASGADATSTVAGDLQSVFNDLSKAGGGHGHHHHPQTSSAGATDGSTAAGSNAQASASNPFQNLAASLLAYTKGQGLGAGGTTSTAALTA